MKQVSKPTNYQHVINLNKWGTMVVMYALKKNQAEKKTYLDFFTTDKFSVSFLTGCLVITF